MKRSLIKVTRCYGKGTRMDIDQKIQQLRNDYVENLGPQDDAYTLKVFEYAGQNAHEWFFRTLCYDAPLECCLGFMREHAKLDTDDEGGLYIIMQGDRRVYTHYVDPDMHGDLGVEPYCYDSASRMLGFETLEGEELCGWLADDELGGEFCSDSELDIIKGLVK